MKLGRYFMFPRNNYNNYNNNYNCGYSNNNCNVFWNRCNSNNMDDINRDKDNKLMAEFICDVTLPDRTSYPINTILTKTWKMKNNGTTKWIGNKIYLAFFKGNESICLDKKKLITNNVDPGNIIYIYIMTPKTIS